MPDGRTTIFNTGGELSRIPVDGDAEPEWIDTGDTRRLNNDHVLSPDGRMIYVSNGDGHTYSVPVEGGAPRAISNDHDRRFAYVAYPVG